MHEEEASSSVDGTTADVAVLDSNCLAISNTNYCVATSTAMLQRMHAALHYVCNQSAAVLCTVACLTTRHMYCTGAHLLPVPYRCWSAWFSDITGHQQLHRSMCTDCYPGKLRLL
jgi:hypothetical protein